MKDVRRTGKDYGWIGLTLVPPMILVGMGLAAAEKWRMGEAAMDDLVRGAISAENASIEMTPDHAVMAKLSDAKSSKEHTATWLRVLSATQTINDKYGGPFAWVSRNDDNTDSYAAVVAAGEPWEVAAIVADYRRDAEPILVELRTMLESEGRVWVPTVYEGVMTRLPEAQATRDVARLLRYCFAGAIHAGDNDAAIELLRINDRLFGPDVETTFVVEELIRMACYGVMQESLRQSLATNVWSEAELESIEQLIGKPFDWPARWKSTIDAETWMVLPFLSQPRGLGGMNELPFEPGSVTIAPSVAMDWITEMQSLASRRDVQSRTQLESLQSDEVRMRYRNNSPIEMDQWLQKPVMNTGWLINAFTPASGSLAAAFVRQSNEVRWTRTVLAMRLFEVRSGYFPESLSELSSVGLPASAMQAFDGGPFAWKETDSGGRVVYNQAEKTTSYDDNGDPRWVRMEAAKKK